MSMPVFLNSCSYDHMPNGQQNEWYDFYREATLELEANAFFPLFWMLLFNPDHIKHAKYIDDFDIDDALSQVDREDCFHEFGERRYPYFVVSQQDALKNLKDRKQTFLDLFEQDLSSYYQHFQELIEEYYPDFILLRTNGLPLTEHSEQSFRQQLSAYALLGQIHADQDHDYWQTTKIEMQKYTSLIYFLQGSSDLEGYRNPPEPLENQNDVVTEPPYKDLADYVYWIFGIIIGLPTVYIWFKTHSWFYAIITFIVLSAIFSFIAIKLTRKRTI